MWWGERGIQDKQFLPNKTQGSIRQVHLFSILKPIVVNPSSDRATNTTQVNCATRGLLNRVPIRTSVNLCNDFTAAKGKRNASGTLITNLLNLQPSSPHLPSDFTLTTRRNVTFQVRPIRLHSTRPGATILALANQRKQILSVGTTSINNKHVHIARVSNIPTSFNNSDGALVVRGRSAPNYVTRIAAYLTIHEVGITSVRIFHTKANNCTIVILRYSSRVPRPLRQGLTALPNVLGIAYLGVSRPRRSTRR